jgi:hypothetical protein
VRYCVTGTLEQASSRILLSVELARTADNAVIWNERVTATPDELQDLRQEMLSRLAANIEGSIVQQEIETARRTPEVAQGAWSSYHRGLDYMFRFNKRDNSKAAALFERALMIDPHFSRALSGLSFTCFQDCFLQYSNRGAEMAQRARSLAEQAVQCDALDPFAHLNLARSLWFENALPESIDRLAGCIELSPSYAQAIYSKAWAEMTQCNVAESDKNAALALRLSPLDPMRYAMLAVRAVSALLTGECDRAADLAEQAARSPGAHKHIAVIAALATYASGRNDRAFDWVSRAREFDPELNGASFLRSFPFAPSSGRDIIERILKDLRL